MPGNAFQLRRQRPGAKLSPPEHTQPTPAPPWTQGGAGVGWVAAASAEAATAAAGLEAAETAEGWETCEEVEETKDDTHPDRSEAVLEKLLDRY